MTTKLPTSQAKTAYGLLSDIAKLALTEPKRMWMCAWGGEAGNACDYYALGDGPACGTVGCIGGWTDVLRPRGDAWETLGLTGEQRSELFEPRALIRDPEQGTLAHAKRVAAHIRRFQRTYRAQLLRTKV
jgi:hypothetical protein